MFFAVHFCKLTIETHVLDGACDLYDKRLRVAFVRWLRDERRFDSLEALRAQIAEDCASASALFRQMAL